MMISADQLLKEFHRLMIDISKEYHLNLPIRYKEDSNYNVEIFYEDELIVTVSHLWRLQYLDKIDEILTIPAIKTAVDHNLISKDTLQCWATSA